VRACVCVCVCVWGGGAHHVVQVVEPVQEQLALVLRQPHVIQPVAHGLVQQPARRTCRQGKALQQGETLQAVAAALRGRDAAPPHHPRPAEPSAPATGGRGRQRARRALGSRGAAGGRTTAAQKRKEKKVPLRFQGRVEAMEALRAGDLPASTKQDAASLHRCKCDDKVHIQLGGGRGDMSNVRWKRFSARE